MTFVLDLSSRILDLDEIASAHRPVLPADPDLPAVVLQRIDSPPVRTHDQGPSTAHVQRWQVDVYDDTTGGAEQALAALVASLDGWVDKVAGIDGVHVVDSRDDWAPQERRVRLSMDLTAHVRKV